MFYVDHIALTYLVNKPQSTDHVAQWFLLCTEFDFSLVYKRGKNHGVEHTESNFPQGALDRNQRLDTRCYTLLCQAYLAQRCASIIRGQINARGNVQDNLPNTS